MARIRDYAVCIAVIHALYAAGIYRAWQLTESRVTPFRAGLAILVVCSIAGLVGYVLSTRLFGLPEPMIVISEIGRRTKGRFVRAMGD